MPKTSGAVLDWVPQKAAQQMQSDATTRFMPVLASPFPWWCSTTRTPGCLRHIFDPLARCSQVRGDCEDWVCETSARRTSGVDDGGLMGDGGCEENGQPGIVIPL